MRAPPVRRIISGPNGAVPVPACAVALLACQCGAVGARRGCTCRARAGADEGPGGRPLRRPFYAFPFPSTSLRRTRSRREDATNASKTPTCEEGAETDRIFRTCRTRYACFGTWIYRPEILVPNQAYRVHRCKIFCPFPPYGGEKKIIKRCNFRKAGSTPPEHVTAPCQLQLLVGVWRDGFRVERERESE